MEKHAASLLLHAKRHLYGEENVPLNPLHAYRVLDAIVTMFPHTDAAKEAATMLHHSQLISSDDPALM